MTEIYKKKLEILNGLYRTKDGLIWNETSDLLNELIILAKLGMDFDISNPPDFSSDNTGQPKE